ncbi:hypothetical protein GH714_009741 [Hevea brasiliensis]|uniref:Retrovirus-related Pol polyprotein from transposon TNT 1-94-like beta-barrel domain-containing protein n=1 Tax=Hevea brasiliensis TaxID=3981 RepID=A0A6A6KMI5_HEVBR|nr:hypothetical protein GH714_009741 [Hevea brasiliensis]
MASSMENASNGAVMATKGVKSNSDEDKYGQAFYTSNASNDDDWIINSGATDHMTFDASDFSKRTPPQRTFVTNANGVAHPVTGAGVISISPSLSLSHTLLVPSLSNKLMSRRIDSRDNDEQLTSGEHAAPIALQSDNEVNVTPRLTLVLEGSPPTENIHEVSSPITHPHTNNLDTSIYVLPFRQNRGKPPKRYSPD